MWSISQSPLRSLAIAAALLGLGGCAGDEPTHAEMTTAASTTSDAVEVQLVDLDGQPFDLWNRLAEQMTVVVFTRTDCPISNRYAPEIRKLYDRFQSRGVEFYLIYVDPQQDSAEIRAHLEAYQYPCPGLRDPDHTLAAFAGATVTPEAVVFDKYGAIVYRGRIDNLHVDFGQARGEPTTHELADAIEATLAGEPVAAPVTKAVGCYIADLE